MARIRCIAHSFFDYEPILAIQSCAQETQIVSFLKSNEFSFTECDKKFSRKHHVKLHLRTHKDRTHKNPFDGIYDEDDEDDGRINKTDIEEVEFIQ